MLPPIASLGAPGFDAFNLGEVCAAAVIGHDVDFLFRTISCIFELVNHFRLLLYILVCPVSVPIPLLTFSPWSLFWSLASLMHFFAAMSFVLAIWKWRLELDQCMYDIGGVKAGYRGGGVQQEAKHYSDQVSRAQVRRRNVKSEGWRVLRYAQYKSAECCHGRQR